MAVTQADLHALKIGHCSGWQMILNIKQRKTEWRDDSAGRNTILKDKDVATSSLIKNLLCTINTFQ